MDSTVPHYWMYSEADSREQPGRWRFVLRAGDGSRQFEAADIEPEARGERLELLVVVRGLEALEQPSRVTLVTASRFVREGIRHGVRQWRNNGWRWEFYGHLVPVKHGDLWQRIEQAMRFHQVDCRWWRFDRPHGRGESPAGAGASPFLRGPRAGGFRSSSKAVAARTPPRTPPSSGSSVPRGLQRRVRHTAIRLRQRWRGLRRMARWPSLLIG